MKHIDFYFDFISPYAWLAFHRWPQVFQGISHTVNYKPILFGAILNHHGQLGPAEIVGKREWTYRQIQWLADQQGCPLQLPSSHPFNPLQLLRLAIATDKNGQPNRWTCEQIFRHIWCDGLEATEPQRFEQLIDHLRPMRDIADADVKQQLQNNTKQAIDLGVFGVPTFTVDDKLFWGQDSLPMLRDYLDNHAWYQTTAWNDALQLPTGIQRQKK